MSVLFVRCPITGKEFSTGIETDEHSFALIPDTLARSYCPYCHTSHWWSKRDLRLSDGDSPVERVTMEG